MGELFQLECTLITKLDILSLIIADTREVLPLLFDTVP